MPKCAFKGCLNFTQYKNSKQVYCIKHLARVRRHGYPEIKKDAYQSLEKLPHKIVDNYIKKNCMKMIDANIANELCKMGYSATAWNVRYRRRKLGVKKYMSGDVLKHKTWIRDQAIKKYGNKCELCDYGLALDAHHIIPRKLGGSGDIENLMVLCPNCHALITRKIFDLESRKDLELIREKVHQLLDSFR